MNFAFRSLKKKDCKATAVIEPWPIGQVMGSHDSRCSLGTFFRVREVIPCCSLGILRKAIATHCEHHSIHFTFKPQLIYMSYVKPHNLQVLRVSSWRSFFFSSFNFETRSRDWFIYKFFLLLPDLSEKVKGMNNLISINCMKAFRLSILWRLLRFVVYIILWPICHKISLIKGLGLLSLQSLSSSILGCSKVQ